MRVYFKLLRVKHWVKNSFVFVPLFFAGDIFDLNRLGLLFVAFFAFSFVASGIYVLNDLRDVEADRNHPVKKSRPLAAGLVNQQTAIGLIAGCFAVGLGLGLLLNVKFGFILLLYLGVNVLYSGGLKHIGILDVMLVSLGFVLRIRGGGAAADVHVSIWLTVMVYLLALFMAFAKRRDDVLLMSSGTGGIRKASKGYNLEFLNAVIIIISAVTVLAYIMYTVSPDSIRRLGTHRLYHTSVFVLAGMFRYLQLTFVVQESGSPTDLLYKDRFLQISILLWVLSFLFLLYFPDITIFS